jgi:phenylpropionate dioxygenase-like ring-hydroxylating dioxygenase large terminal subunit
LKRLACDTWQGFVYVSLRDDAEALNVGLKGLAALIQNFRISDYVPVFSQEETWDTNWKCLVENFMDVYHLHRVHKESFGKYGSSEDMTSLHPGGDAFAYHVIQEREGRKSVHPHPDNTWLMGEDRYKTYLINIFPSHVIQLQPDMLWYLSILPIGTEKVSIRWAVSIPAEILNGAKNPQGKIDTVMKLLHQVNSEDRPIVENVCRTTRSPEAEQGPLSYLERNLWDFGRYLSRRLCR